MKITTIGLDLAKSVFQVHGIADDGTVVVVKRLLRKQMLLLQASKLPDRHGSLCDGASLGASPGGAWA